MGPAGADYEAAHDAVARQAETAINGRAAPPASQQGLPMAPPQRPPGAAPPGMAPPGMPPPAGAYGSSRAGAGGPPAGAPPSYSSYPGRRCLMHDITALSTCTLFTWMITWIASSKRDVCRADVLVSLSLTLLQISSTIP